MVDGETHGCVNSFWYLGDTLDGDGGADLSATARIRNGWMKFRELFPFSDIQSSLLEMKGRVYSSCVRSSMTIELKAEARPTRTTQTWSQVCQVRVVRPLKSYCVTAEHVDTPNLS